MYVGRVVPETQRVTNVQAFYEPLDRYGDWIETDDYGYVFRPEVATRRDWRPYTDGHWVHTGYGWTWQSNEDFGWATYHYGRWTRIERAGWVWVPGREWGPGWVSWRRGNDHCGWAPLPAESRTHVSFTATVDRDYDIGPAAYVFVALSNFGARSYAPVIERPERNVTIIDKTVNITNITYNNTTNNTVVYNGGPSYDLMRARSTQPVENVNVNFVPQNPAIARAKIVNVRQGDTLQVAAPPVAAAVLAAPLRVKEKIAALKVDKGWAGVDPAQAQKVKQEIAATSAVRPRRPQPAAAGVVPAVSRPGVAEPVAAPVVPAPPARTVGAPTTATPQPRPDAPAHSVAPERGLPRATPDPLPKIDKPETPVKVDPSERPVRPESQPPRATPEPLPKPEMPSKPAAVDPVERPKPLDVEPVKTPPAPRALPGADRPTMPLKLDAVEKPKRLIPEPPMPRPDAEPAPKTERTGPPSGRQVLPNAAPEKPAVPDTIREKPAVSRPVVAPARPRVEPPVRVKRPTPEPATPRVPRVERSPVADTPENPSSAPVSKRFTPESQPAPQRIAPPQRPAPEARVPEPRVNRPAPQPAPAAAERIRERTIRQENPVVERAPQPVVLRPQQPVMQRPPQTMPPPQAARPQTSNEEQDKKKKKKDGEQ